MHKKHIAKSTEQLHFEGDGILTNLFHFLWTKDPVFGTIPCVNVPDTVLMNYDEPIEWYFMHKGILKKKGKSKLKIDYIIEKFIRKIPTCGIVAVFMKTKLNDTSGTDIVFEYLNKDEFLCLFSKKHGLVSGVLQKFIQPKGEHNFIIRTIWSPNVCLFEKKECIKKINDKRIDVYERIFTYEGNDFHSNTTPLKGYVLPNCLKKIATNIVSHVATVSFDKVMISRLVLNFKVDETDKIWLLFCSSMRLSNDSKHVNYNHKFFDQNHESLNLNLKLNPPSNINTHLLSTGKPLNLHNAFECAQCGQIKDSQSTFEISYKTIIDGYDYDHIHDYQFQQQKQQQQKILNIKTNTTEKSIITNNNQINTCRSNSQGTLANNIVENDQFSMLKSIIPPLIKRLHPKIKEEAYKILKLDPAFRKKITHVCIDCCIEINNSKHDQICSVTQEDEHLIGTGRLRPELTQKRFMYTTKNIYSQKNEIKSPKIQNNINSNNDNSSMNSLDKSKDIMERMPQLTTNRSKFTLNFDNISDKVEENVKENDTISYTTNSQDQLNPKDEEVQTVNDHDTNKSNDRKNTPSLVNIKINGINTTTYKPNKLYSDAFLLSKIKSVSPSSGFLIKRPSNIPQTDDGFSVYDQSKDMKSSVSSSQKYKNRFNNTSGLLEMTPKNKDNLLNTLFLPESSNEVMSRCTTSITPYFHHGNIVIDNYKMFQKNDIIKNDKNKIQTSNTLDMKNLMNNLPKQTYIKRMYSNLNIPKLFTNNNDHNNYTRNSNQNNNINEKGQT